MPRTRPTSVTVFSIISFVLAAWGVFGLLMSLVVLAIPAMSRNNPVLELFDESPAYALWFKVSIGIGLCALALLVAVGIGLWTMRPWGRKLAIGYAIFAIAWTVVAGVMNFVLMTKPLMDRMSGAGGPEAMGAMIGLYGGLFGSCFSLIFPILLLVFMTRRNVVEAFDPSRIVQVQGMPPPMPG